MAIEIHKASSTFAIHSQDKTLCKYTLSAQKEYTQTCYCLINLRKVFKIC